MKLGISHPFPAQVTNVIEVTNKRFRDAESNQEPESKPRAYFYQFKGARARQRKHLWAVGLEAISAATGAALADVDATPQRNAARTSIALALEAWGCRGDPNKWDIGNT